MTRLVCFDYETIEILPSGGKVASAEFYKNTFRVDSCAFTERVNGDVKSWFVQGEDKVRRELEKLCRTDVKLIIHNAQFEVGVTRCRYPDLEKKLTFHADTMRLVQQFDNGGDKNAFELIHIEGTEDEEEDVKKSPTSGLGLVKACKRILNEPDHKDEAHSWLRANGVKKGHEGRNLHLLPLDILERYNTNDTEATLRLYEYLVDYFATIKFDWRKDHDLFLHSVSDIVDAQIRGIRIERDELQAYAAATAVEISSISRQFVEKFAEPIKLVERDRLLEEIRSRKTLRGRKKYVKRIREDQAKWADDVQFNPGSNAQLQSLFVDKLGIEPVFLTKKGSPSFKSSHLHQWSDGGKLLETRRKRLIVQKQAEALVEKAAYDGRYHVQLRACGTVTGRYSGTGGVNIQALSRRDAGLMTRLVPDPGYVFVSSDMSAGEPSIITEYTRDPNYKYFCFDGIGKDPFYKDGILMVDDIYLAYASVCPLFKDDMYDIFKNGLDGKSFVEMWRADPEQVKNHKRIKPIRKNAKWICLGFGYGLGGNALYPKAIEAGIKTSRHQCKGAFLAYWEMFSGIKAYARKLEAHVEDTGWFQNPFGYRFVPTEVRKSFNGMVQSSVSGLFHWYGILMKHINPFAIYITTIHDENIYMVPEDRVDDFMTGLKELQRHINDQLKWCIDLRFGAVVGHNFYEAK